jgi:hypothetical protein
VRCIRFNSFIKRVCTLGFLSFVVFIDQFWVFFTTLRIAHNIFQFLFPRGGSRDKGKITFQALYMGAFGVAARAGPANGALAIGASAASSEYQAAQ